MTADDRSADMSMNATDLYREELYTDRKVGSIRCLHPVRRDGSDDAGRQAVFVGQAQILTPMGALPLSFEIPAASLEEAVAAYGEAAKVAVDKAVEELKELRREASSSIVLPDAGGGVGALGGAGGVPGGGKLPFG
ncbi:MAG TPA: hypothetical protein ENJ19_07300 [Gammaproteobacteria bacterium]|nr:hypothetical protein [Gammaproteobacteria bacterium]